MEIIDRIKEKTKSSTTIQTIDIISLKAVISFSQTSKISNNNIFLLHLSNLLQKTITPIL